MSEVTLTFPSIDGKPPERTRTVVIPGVMTLTYDVRLSHAEVMRFVEGLCDQAVTLGILKDDGRAAKETN